MIIKTGDLRKLIREVTNTKQKTQFLVRQVVNSAEGYVDSVVAGSPDKECASALQQQAGEIAAYAKWLINHREEGSDSVGMVAKYAMDLAQLADFWKRPVFLGKAEYQEKLKDLLSRMQRSQGKLS